MVTGFHGKIPSHGDFVDRSLPTSFLNSWDEWLQLAIATSKEQLDDEWLNIYLTAPIWQFALSPGVTDESAWLGILVPSVDTVGRYYPLTLAAPVSGELDISQAFFLSQGWFEQLENIALAVLEEGFNADVLDGQLRQCKLEPIEHEPSINHKFSQGLRISTSSQDPLHSMTALTQGLIEQAYQGSFSLWRTSGSEKVNPTLITTSGLPKADQFVALLSGNWPN